MRRPSARTARTAAVTILAAASVAACGLSSTGTPSTSNGGPSGTPIKVGISLSETGQFSADGQASLRGYQLWAADVNSNGGLLGRPVKLVVLNDNSDPTTVKKNYNILITQDHVNLTLGPFSSLLTVPAAKMANQHGYAMTAGSATAPSVYTAKLPNLFSTSAPVARQMVPFANWVAALPPGQRPKTAAYAMVADPFADPPVSRRRPSWRRPGSPPSTATPAPPTRRPPRLRSRPTPTRWRRRTRRSSSSDRWTCRRCRRSSTSSSGCGSTRR